MHNVISARTSVNVEGGHDDDGQGHHFHLGRHYWQWMFQGDLGGQMGDGGEGVGRGHLHLTGLLRWRRGEDGVPGVGLMRPDMTNIEEVGWLAMAMG